ncbi:nuclear transport factor 2 family protein [Streptomyces sp. NPDC007901]|uniref:nuclear transport factor 2 family protein n=1 Tax=Streptomyces sp. NPDC007901 TaxID=3364785 RepID=UPI0036E8C2F0
MRASYGHRPAWSRSGWRGNQDGLGRQPEIPDHRIRVALAADGGLVIAEPQQAVAHSAHALDELNVPELETVLTEDATWTFTMPGQGVLGPVAGRTAVLEFIRDGHTAQTGKVRHHLGNVVVTTTDAAPPRRGPTCCRRGTLARASGLPSHSELPVPEYPLTIPEPQTHSTLAARRNVN